MLYLGIALCIFLVACGIAMITSKKRSNNLK